MCIYIYHPYSIRLYAHLIAFYAVFKLDFFHRFRYKGDPSNGAIAMITGFGRGGAESYVYNK